MENLSIEQTSLKEAGDILVVDDNPENLSFLKKILTVAGYRTRPANDGDLALRSIQLKAPALILLDIKMPGMDGFEVCRSLKADATTQTIPIIFVSALEDAEEKVKGFELGAVDYITKPLNASEVLARVETHLGLSVAQRLLEEQNQQLREAELRYRTVANFNYDWEIWINPAGQWLYCSPSCLRITGYQAAEFIVNPALFIDIAHPDDRSLLEQHLQHVHSYEFQLPHLLEYRILHAEEGRIVWLEHACQSVHDEQGVYLGRRASNRDITDRKKAEMQNLQDRQRLEDFLKLAQMFSESIEELERFVIEKSILLTSSEIGFCAVLDAELQSISSQVWSETAMQNGMVTDRALAQPLILALQEAGLWLETVRWRKVMMVNDYSATVLGKHSLPASHLPLRRFLSVPVMEEGEVIAVILVANKPTDYNEADVLHLRLFAEGLGQLLSHRQNVEALRQSENSYRELFNTIGDAVYVQDQQGRFLDVNQGTEKMYGYPKAFFLGKSPDVIAAPDKNDLPAVATALQKAFLGEPQQFEFWGRRNNGEVFPEEIQLNKGVYFGREVIIGIARDISERKRAEQILRETNAYLENLINCANAPIMVWDAQFHITRFNPAFEFLTGRTEAEVLGRPLGILFPPALLGKSMDLIRKTATGEHWESVEIEVLHRNGSKRIVLWNSATLFAADGYTPLATIAQGQDITKRKWAEKALRETNAYLENLINYANGSIIVWNPQCHIIRFNYAAESLTGWTEAEVIGESLAILFPPAQVENSMALVCKTLNGERWESVEIEILHKNLSSRTVLWNSGTLFTLDGKTPLAVIAQGQDITARKQAEQALAMARDELLNVTNSVPVVVFRYRRESDGTPHLLYLSDRIESLWGVSVTDALQNPLNLFQRIHADDFAAFTAADKAAWESQSVFSYELRVILPNGETRWLYLNSRPSQDEAGNLVYSGIIENITTRKCAEEALRRSEIKFHTLYDSSTDAIMMLNEAGFFDCNKATLELFGCKTQQEFFSHHPADLSPPQQPCGTDSRVLANQYIAIAMEKGSLRFEWMHQRADTGRIFPAEVLLNSMVLDRQLMLQAVVHDISERKQAETELRQAYELAEAVNHAKSDFLSSMSHELFTPMNAVLGFAQILEYENLTDVQQSYVKSILTAGYQLLDLIKEVLAFSVINTEKLDLTLEKVDLATLVQQCLTLIQPLLQAKNIHLMNHLTSTCSVDVLVDAVRLKQVLLNLLSNAVKYNNEQGHIILACEICASKKIRLKITDTGAGLSEEQLARLFLPFERLNAKNSAIEGAGLGLCISKKLMETMNGQIGVDSILGEGCCFWIEIPIA